MEFFQADAQLVPEEQNPYDAFSMINIVTDIGACEALWRKFSPCRSLYDLWEFRFPFWEEYRYELAFVTLSQDENTQGLLPLWKHPTQKNYLWFGDVGDEFNWQEDNTIWVSNPSCVRALIEGAPRPLQLTSLRPEAIPLLNDCGEVRAMNAKSVVALPEGFTLEKFISGLTSANFRHMIRRDLRRVEECHPDKRIDDPRAFDSFLALNTHEFADSPFADARLAATFRRLVLDTRPRPFTVRTISVEIGGDIVGTYCTFAYGRTSFALLYGGDKHRCPGIGHYMNLSAIEDALATGKNTVDFAETDPGTAKERLLPSVPQWMFTSQ